MPNPECACHSLPCSLWPEKSKTWKYFKKDKMGRCHVRRIDTSVPQPNATRTANSRRCTCIEVGDLTLPSVFNSHERSAHALTNRCLWQGGSLAAGFHCCFVLPSWETQTPDQEVPRLWSRQHLNMTPNTTLWKDTLILSTEHWIYMFA